MKKDIFITKKRQNKLLSHHTELLIKDLKLWLTAQVSVQQTHIKKKYLGKLTCTKDFSIVMNISTFRSILDGFWKSNLRLPGN